MPSATIIATDGKFRIVRVENGERIDHVMEKHDGFDALGCERWKSVNDSIGTSGISRQLFEWVLGHALKCPLMKGRNEPE